jgi:hypothetical protein
MFFLVSYWRLFTALGDLLQSIGYYFCKLFTLPASTVPSVTLIPRATGGAIETPQTSLPDTSAGFLARLSAFGKLFVDTGNLSAYFGGGMQALYTVLIVVGCAVPLVLACAVVFRTALKRANNDYAKDSRPLKAFKTLSAKIFVPALNRLKSIALFLRGHGVYPKLWLLAFALHLNLVTIAVEFLAFCLYFVVSFDAGNVYVQLYKLFLDLSVVFDFVPGWVWIVLGLLLFDWLRKKIALARLRHMEMRNRGFINSLPIVTMIVGTMGKKKTTMLTNMCLSQEAMFRNELAERLLENDLKFPYFPWIRFENELRRAVEYQQIYNLATCRSFVRKKRARFAWSEFVDPLSKYTPEQCERSRRKLYGYDFRKHGFVYDDKLKLADLWDVLEVYARLYFIYIVQGSLLVSNYSIRDDSLLCDAGNFPMWDADFFTRDSRAQAGYSRYARILDFDMLRLGRKVVENNVKADGFEFGVVAITESGKERGNMLDNQGKKKDAPETNQKNDLFNLWLKMARHSATVDHFPFVKVFMDEQRPESMGADVRELCDIIHIRDASEQRLAMPFFFVGELLHELMFPRFRRFYTDFRFNRGDNILFVYLFKKIAAALNNYYRRIYNRFSYCVLDIETERGTMNGARGKHCYYLATKKIYARRFATDAFSDYFARKAIRSPVGIRELDEYATERASLAELRKQNSYFIDDLTQHIEE